MRSDDGGQFWDTLFDVVSLVSSVIEVVAIHMIHGHGLVLLEML
jgi:hypothetical protein